MSIEEDPDFVYFISNNMRSPSISYDNGSQVENDDNNLQNSDTSNVHCNLEASKNIIGNIDKHEMITTSHITSNKKNKEQIKEQINHNSNSNQKDNQEKKITGRKIKRSTTVDDTLSPQEKKEDQKDINIKSIRQEIFNNEKTTDETNDKTPNQEEDLPPLASQEELQNYEEQSRYDNKWDQQEVLDDGLTREMNNAYEFSHRAGITSMNNASEADMFGPLTRIAMAKMLSQYAINVLGKTPDTDKTISFPDVSAELDAEYNNGVTLAYQLGIMWINIEEFRPNDLVTRAEFGTALSRLLFGLADGEWAYYETHLQKLMDEKIITNDNPDLQELRGYVMIMLMRSAQ